MADNKVDVLVEKPAEKGEELNQSGWKPTEAELYALTVVNSHFDDSKMYYTDKHERMKRLYARYFNSPVRASRPTGYSDERLGQVYRVAEVLYSGLEDALLKQAPFGKITGEGDEDYPDGKVIDKVNRWQQNQTYIYNDVSSALWYSVICGTGFINPGWDFREKRYYDNEEETIQLPNPADPFGPPIEIPTGKTKSVEKFKDMNRIDTSLVEPWNVFPTSGATKMDRLPGLTYRVKMTRHEILDMQRSGYLENVEFIPNTAYGTFESESYLDETKIFNAKKENKNETSKEFIWMLFTYIQFPFFNYAEHIDHEDFKRDDAYDCLIIKPQHAEIINKLELNTLAGGAIPAVPFKYAGPNDTFFGISPLEIAEILIQLDEDMFNLTQDNARREVYKRIMAVEGIDHSELSPARLEGIVTIPKAIADNVTTPLRYMDTGTSALPNLMAQRQIVFSLIDEVTSAFDFKRGAGGDPDETATKTIERSQAISTRLGSRVRYYERNGMWWWMQWQTVLNAIFLDDETVSRVANIPAFLNPFKKIEHFIPIDSADFSFEGSTKAVDDPIQAQILRQMLEISPNIPPGFGIDGKLKKVNPTTIFEELFRKLDAGEDIEKYFTEVTPKEQQANLLRQMLASGESAGGSSPLEATSPEQLINTNNPRVG